MSIIPIPLGRSMRLGGPAFVLGVGALVLSCQFYWAWRLVAVSAVLAIGTLLWIRYLRRRPISMSIKPDGRIGCERADGCTFEVVRVLPGVVRPWLLSSRLLGGEGEVCDLFVPGRSLPESAHWQLRCALTRFRAAKSQSENLRGV
jgi:hypothetical protein